jgi:Septum formation
VDAVDPTACIGRKALTVTVPILLLMLVACQSARESTLGGAGGRGQATDVFDLAEGDCFSPLEGKQGTQVEVVSCDAPHVFEVFHIFDHPAAGSEPYPGRSEISAYAEELCISPFEEFVEKAYDESQWSLTTITPTKETWSVGDREIVCTLSLEDESEVTGSARGSAE